MPSSCLRPVALHPICTGCLALKLQARTIHMPGINSPSPKIQCAHIGSNCWHCLFLTLQFQPLAPLALMIVAPTQAAMYATLLCHLGEVMAWSLFCCMGWNGDRWRPVHASEDEDRMVREKDGSSFAWWFTRSNTDDIMVQKCGVSYKSTRCQSPLMWNMEASTH